MSAASSTGKPPTPVPNATRASERAPSSSAFHRVAAVARRMMSAEVGPPSSIVAAWMTQRDGISPALVSTASPSPIGDLAALSRWSSSPAARAIAPATPPPCSSWVLAALAIASTASVVMSASRTSTSAMRRGLQAQRRGDHRRREHRLGRAGRVAAVLRAVGVGDLRVELVAGHGRDVHDDRLALDAQLGLPVGPRAAPPGPPLAGVRAHVRDAADDDHPDRPARGRAVAAGRAHLDLLRALQELERVVVEA